jgi:hypothetical protein
MLPTKFQFISPSDFKGEAFKKSTNQKQKLSVATMLANESGRNKNLYRGPSIDTSNQVSVHLAKQFQSRRFLETDQLEAIIACGGHVCQWIGTK